MIHHRLWQFSTKQQITNKTSVYVDKICSLVLFISDMFLNTQDCFDEEKKKHTAFWKLQKVAVAQSCESAHCTVEWFTLKRRLPRSWPRTEKEHKHLLFLISTGGLARRTRDGSPGEKSSAPRRPWPCSGPKARRCNQSCKSKKQQGYLPSPSMHYTKGALLFPKGYSRYC